MIQHLWIFWLPMLFLPNFGEGGDTAYGSLELSDFLIGPYLILLCLVKCRNNNTLLLGRLVPLLLGFVGWAMLSTLLVQERYGYLSDIQVKIGVLKLAKFLLYSSAGLLTARALAADGKQRELFIWSLLVVGIVVGVSLFKLQRVSDELLPGQAMEGYKTKNAVSVMMAMLICYLGGLWIGGHGSYRWRSLAGPGLLAMILGFLFSNGRGGWVAALCGTMYLIYRRGLRPGVLAGLLSLPAMLIVAYGAFPEFRDEVERTLWPDENYLAYYQSGVGGIDDGARLACWTHELVKLSNAPLLGTGFFHRGAASGLWTDGSHNFFIQMFLETGIIGGLIIIGIFIHMWRAAGSDEAREVGEDAPLRSALIAAVIGGMTGEYFYGGTTLLTLFLIYAPVGALTRRHSA